MTEQKNLIATVLCAVLLAACSGSSLLDEIELPTFGNEVFMSGDQESLEVPPDLTSPNTDESLNVPGSKARVSATAAAFGSYVLPERLDLRLRREGNVTWLAVDVAPVTLWPEVQAFLQRSGFKITESDPAQGYVETAWRERRLPVTQNTSARLRTRFRVRLEREPNSITNVFISMREAGYSGGEWSILPPDNELERRMLFRFRDYLASGREVAGPKMASFEDVEHTLDIDDIEGVAVLRIGQRYSEAWRRIGVTLDRAGLSVRADDRSRGIYLVQYSETPVEQAFAIDGAGGGAGYTRLLQLHLLANGSETLVTVHPNRRGESALPYALAQRVLKQVVMAYPAAP